MPSGSRLANSSTAKPAKAEQNENAIQANRVTNRIEYHPFQEGDAADLDDLIHFVATSRCQREGADEYEGAPDQHVTRRSCLPLASLKGPQPLAGHRQRRLRREKLRSRLVLTQFGNALLHQGTHR